MRLSGCLLPVILFLSAPLLYATEPLTCSQWLVSSQQNETSKLLYLAGYLDGVAMTATAASVRFDGPHKGKPEEEVTNELMRRVWPKNLKVENVKVLVDEYCRKADNKTFPIPQALFSITIEANKKSK